MTLPEQSLPSFPSPTRTGRRTFLGALGFALLAACGRASGAGESSPSAPLLPPADLAARIADVKAGKVVVLHVGPEYLWRKAHVPGSRWIGEAGSGDGEAALQAALKDVPAQVEMVAYCGCCPVSHCPNLRPARRLLAGRAGASFLDLPTNFRTDWMNKGLPVESA